MDSKHVNSDQHSISFVYMKVFFYVYHLLIRNYNFPGELELSGEQVTDSAETRVEAPRLSDSGSDEGHLSKEPFK